MLRVFYNICNEPEQNLGRGLLQQKTGLNPTTSNLLLTVPRRCFCFDSIFVRFLFDYNFLLILFRIAWWPSAGKELSSWLSDLVGLILCPLNCMSSFPVGCLGQGVKVPPSTLRSYIQSQFSRTAPMCSDLSENSGLDELKFGGKRKIRR